MASREKMLAVLREELEEIKEKFGTPRRTELCDAEFESDIEDLIQREDMVVTITHGGYINVCLWIRIARKSVVVKAVLVHH